MASTATKSKAAREATALLRADHKHVSNLFNQYQKAQSANEKSALAADICKELTVHAQIEEEIFYPAVNKALKDHELVPEATVEHATMKSLIAQLEGGNTPDEDMFDAKMTVLSEYVKHHVKEEQNEMFPKARATNLNMKELGALLAARKDELLAKRK
ncbi:MAG: hemerythrin domain-containing protein [Burkholderiales bacterium]